MSYEPVIELTLENIGPFANASINIRKFTVITGMTACGKSYLLRLLYTLFRTLSGLRRQASRTGESVDLKEKFQQELLRVAKSANVDLVKHGKEKGLLALRYKSPDDVLALEIKIDRDGTVKVSDEQGLRELATRLDVSVLYLSEDRLIAGKYFLPLLTRMLFSRLSDLIYALYTSTTFTQMLPEEVKRSLLDFSAPIYVVEQLFYTMFSLIPSMQTPEETRRYLDHLMRDIGTITYDLTRGELVYCDRSGHVTSLANAPEAIANMVIMCLPIITLLKLLVDHLEAHLTPPLAERVARLLVEIALRADEKMYTILTVHNIDTFIIVSHVLREALGDKYEHNVTMYEFVKVPSGEVEIRKLEVSRELGVEIPRYLDDYMTLLFTLSER